jgi:hypothetical protein
VALVSLLFAADGCCCVVVFNVLLLVGHLYYGGQRGLELAGLLHLYVICFHQTVMIAFKKRHPYLFAARIAPKPCVLVCVCSVS